MKAIYKEHTVFSIIKWAVLGVFIGRAWQHFFWDAPFRAFFWDERLLKPVVEGWFGMNWTSYVTSDTTDNTIQLLKVSIGVVYLASFFVVLFIEKISKRFKWILWLGGLNLVILAVLTCKEKFYYVAQFLEYSTQYGIPFVLFYYHSSFIKNHLVLILKLLVACTFVSHGLFAVGYYPVPAHFVAMVINILGVSQEFAFVFLEIAGIMDFIVAVGIFIPKVQKYALWYMVVWGFLTAFARVVSGFHPDFMLASLNAYLFETIIRLAHGLIPLALIYLVTKEKLD